MFPDSIGKAVLAFVDKIPMTELENCDGGA